VGLGKNPCNLAGLTGMLLAVAEMKRKQNKMFVSKTMKFYSLFLFYDKKEIR